jgi:hypothetical protein
LFNRDGYEVIGGEDGEDYSKPLTREELKNRVMEGVIKRENEASKDGFQYDLSVQKQKNKNK